MSTGGAGGCLRQSRPLSRSFRRKDRAMRSLPRSAHARHANRCPDCDRRLYRWGLGQMLCADCVAIARGPCAARPAAECDVPLSCEEADRRAAQFSRTLGAEVTAEGVLSADRDWLARYGRRVDDVYDTFRLDLDDEP